MPHPAAAGATLLAACAACAVQAQGAPNPPAELVSYSVSDAPAENGSRLNATFRELRREADHSLVQATITSGGSVSSAMFVLRGVCMVLRARTAPYVASAPEPSAPPRSYRLTFPDQPRPEQLVGREKSVFSAADCKLLGVD